MLNDAPTIYLGNEPVLDFGWLDERRRTKQQNEVAAAIESAMPKFEIKGKTDEHEKKVVLTQTWEHPKTVDSLGFLFPGIRQKTGSCVGASGGNVVFTLLCLEILMDLDPERLTVPFWPLTYGRSRFHGGLHGPGEGSFGDAWAKAISEDGIIAADRTGLPNFFQDDGLMYGRETELLYSDGAAIDEELLTAARKNCVKTVARVRSADELEQAIRNYHPVTVASMYGYRTDPREDVLLAYKSGAWAHQMAIIAVWIHHTLGRLFGLLNQWGRQGVDPGGLPGPAVWIREDDAHWMCKTGEAIAHSRFDGFPAQQFAWGI